MSWIPTASGRRMVVADPDPEEVRLEDIAAGLARQCRFNGQITADHYSVAEHCVVMALECPPEIALHCLLHDAAEAYLGDIVMPVKRLITGFDELEDCVLRAIYQGLGIEWPSDSVWAEVKTHDLRALATEKIQLVSDQTEWPVLVGVEPYEFELYCWDAETAKREWLNSFATVHADYLHHRREVYHRRAASMKHNHGTSGADGSAYSDISPETAARAVSKMMGMEYSPRRAKAQTGKRTNACERCPHRGIDGGPSPEMVCEAQGAPSMGFIIQWEGNERVSYLCPLERYG